MLNSISMLFEIDLSFLQDEIKAVLNEIDRILYRIKTGDKLGNILLYLDGIYIETARMNTLSVLMLSKAVTYKRDNIELRNFLEDFNNDYVTLAMSWIDTAKSLYKENPNQNTSNIYKLLTKLKNLLKEADLKLAEAIDRGLFA